MILKKNYLLLSQNKYEILELNLDQIKQVSAESLN